MTRITRSIAPVIQSGPGTVTLRTNALVADTLKFDFCSGDIVGSTTIVTAAPVRYTLQLDTEDVDGCANPDYPCFESEDGLHRASCTDDESSAGSTAFTCSSCPTGWEGTGLANGCTDIDGCASNPCFSSGGNTVECTDNVRPTALVLLALCAHTALRFCNSRRPPPDSRVARVLWASRATDSPVRL